MTDLRDRFDLDDEGFPVLLSANKIPDPLPQASVPPTTVKPTTIPPEEWSRRMDAVREAAREFETLNSQDLRERLRGVTNRELADSDLATFTADVRAAMIDDLIDILDQLERGSKRGRRTVRLSAPRGYMRKTLNALTDDELRSIAPRLKARGWTKQQIATGFVRRLPMAARGGVAPTALSE